MRAQCHFHCLSVLKEPNNRICNFRPTSINLYKIISCLKEYKGLSMRAFGGE